MLISSVNVTTIGYDD